MTLFIVGLLVLAFCTGLAIGKVGRQSHRQDAEVM